MGVIMQLRFAVAVSSLALGLPLASVSAQSTTPPPAQTTAPSAQSTTPVTARWSFSLGIDPTHFDLSTPDPGVEARVVANLTRSWQSAHSRWTRSISLMVGADAPVQVQAYMLSDFGPFCDCPTRVSRRYAALTGGVSYDLFHVSRFTPYLAGGTGIYYNGYKRSPVRAPVTPSEVAFYQYGGYGNNYISLGVNAGLGLKLRLGSHELFIEQMLHEFDINRRGLAITPLNIGFRF
jgi:hypothetical protein